MAEPIRGPRPAGGGRRLLALLGAGLFAAAAVVASRNPIPPAPAAVAQDAKVAASAAPDAVAAAEAFLAALDPGQREKAVFDFDSPKKANWSNLPVTFVPRNGVRLGDLTKEQRAKAMGVVAAVLSKDGYQKVLDIMDGDQKLAEGVGSKGGKDKGGKDKGGKGGPMFGTDQYFLAVFGRPAADRPWMVQFGGHHLAVNVTVVGNHFIITPTHTAAQPAVFKRDGKDVRPLGREADAAYRLIGSLDEKQRAAAVIGDRPQGELLLGPGRDGRKIEPQGVKGTALSADQQDKLLDVIETWVSITEPGSARRRMAAVKERIGDTYFAWSGPTAPGSAAYFRVQGPTVVIEYAPQGGTDHIHTVIRNPGDDYGVGSLRR